MKWLAPLDLRDRRRMSKVAMVESKTVRAEYEALPDFDKTVVFSSRGDQARVMRKAGELCLARQTILPEQCGLSLRRDDS